MCIIIVAPLCIFLAHAGMVGPVCFAAAKSGERTDCADEKDRQNPICSSFRFNTYGAFEFRARMYRGIYRTRDLCSYLLLLLLYIS